MFASKKRKSHAQNNPENTSPHIYNQIRDILTHARHRAWQSINHEKVCCYWEIGRILLEDEQKGEERAVYGGRLLADLSKKLSTEFGKGFTERNLRNMRSFFLTYPIRNALRAELSWTHYRILLRVEKPEARAFYEMETINAKWSTREQERQKGTAFDRTGNTVRRK